MARLPSPRRAAAPTRQVRHAPPRSDRDGSEPAPPGAGSSRGRRLAARLAALLLRLALAGFFLWIAVSIPLPTTTPRLFSMVQVPIAVLLFIIFIGIQLYDTFFYDRYE